MKIGYFGGSFDPVHLGHLVLAEACREGAGLDRVIFLPAGSPPHKQGRAIAAARHRVAMLRLAVQESPSFAVDEREIERSGVSYTIDTVLSLFREIEPTDEAYWLIGADTLPELPTWRDAAALLDLIPFLTAARPGYDPESALQQLEPVFGEERTEDLAAGLIYMPLVGVSSTSIRTRLGSGRSIRYLVPDAVREYLLRERLYTP